LPFGKGPRDRPEALLKPRQDSSTRQLTAPQNIPSVATMLIFAIRGGNFVLVGYNTGTWVTLGTESEERLHRDQLRLRKTGCSSEIRCVSNAPAKADRPDDSRILKHRTNTAKRPLGY